MLPVHVASGLAKGTMIEGRPFMHLAELLIIFMILPMRQPPGAASAATCAERLELSLPAPHFALLCRPRPFAVLDSGNI